MRIITASFIAMATGWGVMIILVLGVVGALEGFRMSVVRDVSWFGICSAVVVAVTWFFVYLPVYAYVPRRSEFWEWKVCLTVGVLVGALVPFGIMFLAAPAAGRGSAGLFLLMPAVVGGVAAAVGRWLVDWSRGYEDCEKENCGGRGRIPWLRA